ncbi:MAG: tyrosine--tRNA ligase [Firmicutes bacterium]|nr:tyrosine--tRNA ligase [Bacillota bacterium]
MALRETGGTALGEVREQVELLLRGTVGVWSPEELERKLGQAGQDGRPLRVKLGADPSAPDIHLGHAVVLRKLRQFQDLGHQVLFIIGDFTGRIGDPSGRSETRRPLTEEEVRANARTYEEQVYRILDPERTEILFNSSWLGRLNFYQVVELCSHYTVARMLERDEFAARYREGRPISIHEFLYPLAQAYDSIATRADVELGGTDQTFNFLLTRDVMREYGLEPQVVLTMPLLVGLDGVQKMSKSLGNYVGITEAPEQMYGKLMSLPDHLIPSYFELCTEVPMVEVRAMARDMEAGQLNPRLAKMRLAREIVALYHGGQAAREAEERFVRVFSRREIPADVPEKTVSISAVDSGTVSEAAGVQRRDTAVGPEGERRVRVWLPRLLVLAGLASSHSEARRLIAQGGVRLDGSPVTDPEESRTVPDGTVVQVGWRRFVRVRWIP